MTVPTHPAERAPLLRLELVKGQGPATYELGPRDAPMSIGRKEGENQLVVRDEQSTVSRRHATIEPTREGYRIRDLNSRNGVRVQGRPVPADGTLLRDGDEIQLGLAVLRAHIARVEPPPVADEDRTIQEVVAPPPRPAPPPSRPEPPVVRASPPPQPEAPAPRREPPAPRAEPPPPAPPAAPAQRPAAPAPSAPRPAPPPRDEPAVVDQIGPFAIHRALHASSGLTLEYATDTRQRRHVLVRRWRGLELGFFARRRFRRAYETASTFRHETVLAPIEVGVTDRDTWVVYPPLDGVTAGSVVRVGGRDLRIDLAVYVVREACRAVEALEKTGGGGTLPEVTDHDVLIGRDGSVRLVYVADAGGVAADERYAAPEEDAGGGRDGRSAVFSLGILLYELLVREPIAGTQKLMLPSVDTRRIQVSQELAAAVTRAVEVRPHERFAHAGDLGHLLTQVLDQLAPDFRPEQVAAWVASRFAQ